MTLTFEENDKLATVPVSPYTSKKLPLNDETVPINFSIGDEWNSIINVALFSIIQRCNLTSCRRSASFVLEPDPSG